MTNAHGPTDKPVLFSLLERTVGLTTVTGWLGNRKSNIMKERPPGPFLRKPLR